MLTMFSTLSSGRLENATKRGSSKRTRLQDGKKSGTIFSKQSNGEDGRFENKLFCLIEHFHICIEQSFVSFNFSDYSEALDFEQVKDEIWNLYQNLKSVPKNETFWASASSWMVLPSFVLECIFYLFVLRQSCSLLKKWSQFPHSLYKCWFLFQGNLKKQHCFYSLNVTNIIDITSHALLLIYHRKRTLWESAKFGQTPWILPDDNVAWFYLFDQVTHNQPKMHSISIIVWKGPPYVSMYCNDLTGVNC